MHRRPAPTRTRGGKRPPRVTVVTPGWGNDRDERQFATRTFAGAATTVAEVTILHLTSSPSGVEETRDGAFRLRELPASSALPIEEAILLAALHAADASGRLPAVSGLDLHALEGGASAEIGPAIAKTEPDVLVIAGLNQSWLAYEIGSLAPRPRVVVLPLMGDDIRLAMPGYRDFLDWADLVCTISPSERERVAGLAPPARYTEPEIVDLPIVVPVNRAAAAHRVAGLTRFDNYAVFLRGFPEGTVEHDTPPDYPGLRATVPGLGIADVSHREWHAYSDDLDYVVPIGPSRVNLWRLVWHSIALVDLRPGGVLGRELIESLLIGTPVVVPATHPRSDIAVESGGGFVYGDEPELAHFLNLLSDKSFRAEVSERGREWAIARHGDGARFVRAVAACVNTAAPAGGGRPRRSHGRQI